MTETYEADIEFTDSAAIKVSHLINEENNSNLRLRVYITGGGCSGFSYGFMFDEEDKEAVRQHAVAAINMTQQVKKAINEGNGADAGPSEDNGDEPIANTAFVDGVRQYVMDVTNLDVDFIDRINPFGEAYAILAKSLSEERLRQLSDIIAAKKSKFTLEEARDLAKRAAQFKRERGRLPSMTSTDPWEKRIAEGMNAFAQMKAEADQNG